MHQLLKGDVKIELEDIGEGYGGDYNESDPDDEPLLRFSCYVRGELLERYRKQSPYQIDGDNGLNEWVSLSDASYCTRLSARMDDKLKHRALAMLMSYVHQDIEALTPKRACEKASWISTYEVENYLARRGNEI